MNIDHNTMKRPGIEPLATSPAKKQKLDEFDESRRRFFSEIFNDSPKPAHFFDGFVACKIGIVWELLLGKSSKILVFEYPGGKESIEIRFSSRCVDLLLLFDIAFFSTDLLLINLNGARIQGKTLEFDEHIRFKCIKLRCRQFDGQILDTLDALDAAKLEPIDDEMPGWYSSPQVSPTREPAVSTIIPQHDPPPPIKLSRHEKRMKRAEENREKKESIPVPLVAAIPETAPVIPPIETKTILVPRPPYPYVQIADLKFDNEFPHKLYTLAGVVTAINTKPTRTGEFICAFKVVDSTTVSQAKEDAYIPLRGLSCTSFNKILNKLPCPEVGDVLILRSLKLEFFSDETKGKGYGDRFEWIIRSHITGNFHHGKTQSLDDFNSYYQPNEEEMAYCNTLAAWWLNVETMRKEALGIVNKLGADDLPVQPVGRKKGRCHRLMSETTPNVEPQGFFDCTVEILNTFRPDSGPSIIYITDYTPLTGPGGIHGDWCREGLAPMVLKTEMWDYAKPVADSMEPGDFWTMKNIRMRQGRDGNLEGKIAQNKLTKLDVEAHGEDNVILKALLQRKAEFEAENHIPELPYKPIKDFIGGIYHNCVVEVLHIALEEDPPHFFVSDYSQREELSKTRPAGPWTACLDKTIVQVNLESEVQLKAVKQLEPGSIISIQLLRLKTYANGQFRGALGGPQDLIRKLDQGVGNQSTGNAIDALLKRKWALTEPKPQPEPKPRKAVSGKIHAIRDIPAKSDSRLLYYRCIGRIIGIEPVEYETTVTIQCTQCGKPIPNNRKACLICHDILHKFVKYTFVFGVRVEDDNGDWIDLSVEDNSAPFQIIKASELSDYQRQLKEIIDPLLVSEPRDALFKLSACVEEDIGEYRGLEAFRIL
ncbi:hypothetical protein C8J56DRAFT_1028943 [Mycena floridula]|nr:hypothetical protein C8J56DRAFT_1028943 [Mycena floridula]